MKTLIKATATILLLGIAVSTSKHAGADCDTWQGVAQNASGTSNPWGTTCFTTYNNGFVDAKFSHTITLTAQRLYSDLAAVHISGYNPSGNLYGYYDGVAETCSDNNSHFLWWGAGGQSSGPTFNTVDSCSTQNPGCRTIICGTGLNVNAAWGGAWLASCKWYGTC